MKKYIFKELISYLKNNGLMIDSNFSENEHFTGINSLKSSTNSDLSFFHNLKYKNDLISTKSKGCFINEDYKKFLPSSCLPIIVKDPYQAFALTTNFLYSKIKSDGQINPTSKISNNVILGKNIQINSNVIINENCSISDDCIIYDNTVIGPNVSIGKNTTIMSNSVIKDTKIGNNCLIQSGVIIGDKGFGFTPKNKIEVIHIGNVVIGNNVEIGSNTTIDKASLNSTIIEDNVRIDNLVQIAHGVSIGKNTIIAAQSGISGSTRIGENCLLGGQVGLAGHINIGNNVTIAAKSGVTKNIKDNSVIAGFPAIDIKLWRKNIVNQYKKIK